MQVFIFILKLIGVILAFCLLLALLAIGYALFAPIVYRIGGEHEAESRAYVDVYDPLRLAKLSIAYENGHLRRQIQLLWGLLKRGGGGGAEEEAPEAEEETPEVDGVDAEETDGETPEIEEWGLEEELPDESEEGVPERPERIEAAEDVASERSEEPEADAESKPEMSPPDEDIGLEPAKSAPDEDFLEPRLPREPDTHIRPPRPPRPPRMPGEEGKPKRPEGRLSKIQYMLSDEGNHRAFKLLWDGGLKLFYRVRPQITVCDGAFATGWPDRTGELLGVIALCPLVYEDGVHLYPDFESETAYARGRLELTGRVRLIHPALFGLKVLANRDCRRLYRQIRNL